MLVGSARLHITLPANFALLPTFGGRRAVLVGSTRLHIALPANFVLLPTFGGRRTVLEIILLN